MLIIEYTTPGLSLDGDLDLMLNTDTEVVMFDRSVNGRVLITGTSTLAVGGQLDLADLAGRAGQPMVVEAVSVGGNDGAGLTGAMAIRTPLEPGNTNNATRDTDPVISVVNSPIVSDAPFLVPALHRLAFTLTSDGPFRLIIQCRELQAGVFQSKLVQGNLTA